MHATATCCETKLTSSPGRHEAYYISKANQAVRVPSSEGFEFLAEELINVQYSHKACFNFATPDSANSRLHQFSEQDAFTLFTDANLRPIQRWADPTSNHSLWLLERPTVLFPLLKSPDGVTSMNPFSVPSVASWETLWSLWDTITMGMVSPNLLYEKPIPLRHICLFYLGHIPTFLDIHLSRLLGEPHTEPDNFKVRSGRSRPLADTDPMAVYLRERHRSRRRRSNPMSCERAVRIWMWSYR